MIYLYLKKALEMLRENRDLMDKLAAFLIEKETITGKEFMEIFRREKGIPEPEEKKDKTEESESKRTATQETESKENEAKENEERSQQTDSDSQQNDADDRPEDGSVGLFSHSRID